jgi:hypothetical protein
VGRYRAALVVGLALHFALRGYAGLRSGPSQQDRKNRDPVGRPRRGSSFLRLASENFFESNSQKKQKEVQDEKRGHF